MLGCARRFKAEIVNYADDFAVLGRAPAAEMLAAVEGLMRRLKLPMNAEMREICTSGSTSVDWKRSYGEE